MNRSDLGKGKKYLILEEVHLYSDKGELLVKDIIWLISWIGGIYVVRDATDKRTLASAYLIFSLSMLMEFGMKIKEKEHYISRIIHVIFCALLGCILLLSIVSLCGGSAFIDDYSVMYNCSKWIMIFIVLDWIIAWIVRPVSEDELYLNTKMLESDGVMNEEKNKFQDKLLYGNLGSISKGEKNE